MYRHNFAKIYPEEIEHKSNSPSNKIHFGGYVCIVRSPFKIPQTDSFYKIVYVKYFSELIEMTNCEKIILVVCKVKSDENVLNFINENELYEYKKNAGCYVISHESFGALLTYFKNYLKISDGIIWKTNFYRINPDSTEIIAHAMYSFHVNKDLHEWNNLF